MRRSIFLLLCCSISLLHAQSQTGLTAAYEPIAEISAETNGQVLLQQPQGAIVDAEGFVYVADRDQNRILKFDRNGQLLLSWGAPGSGEGEFDSPSDLAIGMEGNLFVVDAGNNRIQKFSPDGKFLLSFGSPGIGNGQFMMPTAIAADAEGHIYVSESQLFARIQKFDLKGSYVDRFGSPVEAQGDLAFPVGMAVAPNGHLFVADLGRSVLLEFSASGELLNTISSIVASGGEDTGLNGPADIEIGGNGNMFLLDIAEGTHRIYSLDTNLFSDGFYFTNGSVEGGMREPTSLGLDTTTNRLYFTDAERGKLVRLTANLGFFAEYGVNSLNGFGALGAPSGVAVDETGAIYISDSLNGEIARYNADYTFSNIAYRGTANGPGNIDRPGPLRIAENGDIYVIESGKAVNRFRNDGTFVDSTAASFNQEYQGLHIGPDGSIWLTYINPGSTQPPTGFRQFTADFGLGPSSESFNLQSPFGLTINRNGNIIIADTTSNNVFRYNPINFSFLNSFEAPGVAPFTMDRPRGLALDHRGNILVADSRNHRILKYSPTGDYITAYGTYGSRPGAFNTPTELVVGEGGLVYVLDAGNRRVQVLEPCREVVVDSREICAGDSTLFEGIFYGESGIYERVFVSQEGCDSIRRLALTVLPLNTTDLDTVICAGETVDFSGQLLNETGVYQDTFQAVNGCDSLVTLHLRVAPKYEIDTLIGICRDATYQLGDQLLTQPGEYSEIFMSRDGCDSTVNLTLQILDTVRTTLIDTICIGDTLVVGDQSFFTTTTGTEVLFPANLERCDSIVTVSLTVLDTFRTERSDTICAGESLQIGDSLFHQSGFYEVIFPANSQRCDSVVEVSLTVLDTFRVARFDTICQGDSLVIDTFRFRDPGQYEVVYPRNDQRCDSIVVVNLTVLDTFRTQRFDTICVDEVLIVGNQILEDPGIHEVIFPRNDERCDSTVEVHLTVLDTFRSFRTDTICQGNVLRIGGRELASSGRYEVVFPPNERRCDSTVVVDLTVLPTFRTVRFDTICAGETLRVGDAEYNDPGTYEYVFPRNRERCDSVIEINLHVLPSYREVNRVTICSGDTFRINGQERTTSGQLVFPGQTEDGCDSTIIYDVSVLPTYFRIVDTSICAGEQLTIGNSTFRSPGTFQYTFPPTDTRCDSILEIQLTVKESYDRRIEQTICSGDTYTLGDLEITQPGTYTYTFPENDRRCDSTVTVDVQVLATVRDTLDLMLCPGDVLFVGAQRIDGPGTYNTILTAANGCDSLLFIRVTPRPPVRTFLEERVCEADGYRLGDRVLRESGLYRDTLVAANGCDSIIELQLLVEPSLFNRTTRTICAGESVQFAGRTIRESGMYRDSFLAQTGCYFYLELDLTVRPEFTDTTFVDICAGQSYTFEGEVYSQSGLFSRTFQSAEGCDSIRYLQLAVEAPEQAFLEQTICAGEQYIWRGDTLTEAGQYLDTLQTARGCDSIVNLLLNVRSAHQDTLDINLCGQNSYTFGDQIIETPGIYTDTFTNRQGCDSIVTIRLSFEDSPDDIVSVGGILMSANINNATYQWINCRDTTPIPNATNQFFIPEVNGRYAVIIETEACTYLSDCFEMNVGVISNTETIDISDDLSLYPNPVEQAFQLRLGNWSGRLFDWQILDLRGRQMKACRERIYTDHRISVAQLPAGMYWLSLRTEDGHTGRLRFVRTQE